MIAAMATQGMLAAANERAGRMEKALRTIITLYDFPESVREIAREALEVPHD
jgi:hypothetical protein